MRILFVDDQQRELDGMTNMMDWADIGAEVVGAYTNPVMALEAAARGETDIIITDVVMQHMDGLALVKQVKTLCPAMKCVVISGFDDFKFVSKAIENGADGYLLKPLLVNELIQILKRLFLDIQSERARTRMIWHGLLAQVILGSTQWAEFIPEQEADHPVCVVAGDCPSMARGVLARITLEDGSKYALLDGAAAMAGMQNATEIVPCRDLREAFLKKHGVRADDSEGQDLIRTIKENIDAHLNDDPDLQAALKNVYLSTGYANERFKKATGMTIHRYIVFKRLERAAALLLSKDEPLIRDVAQKCGFSDASHFINSFQKQYGVTPERYRKTHKHI